MPGGSAPGPAAGRHLGAALALLRFRKAGVLPRPEAPGLEVRGARAFEAVANLRRCYLRREPVFLRSLLRLVGHKVDRRFYFRRLLPGALRGPAGRRAACSYALLRNSFSGKWGSFARQQRPLALSSVQRGRAAPGRAGLSARSALPGAATCVYADPPYIFPGQLLWHEGAGARPGLPLRAPRRTLRERPALRRERQRRKNSKRRIQRIILSFFFQQHNKQKTKSRTTSNQNK